MTRSATQPASPLLAGPATLDKLDKRVIQGNTALSGQMGQTMTKDTNEDKVVELTAADKLAEMLAKRAEAAKLAENAATVAEAVILFNSDKLDEALQLVDADTLLAAVEADESAEPIAEDIPAHWVDAETMAALVSMSSKTVKRYAATGVIPANMVRKVGLSKVPRYRFDADAVVALVTASGI